MRKFVRLCLGIVVTTSLGIVGAAHGDPLDPNAYASLGSLNPAGNVTIDTDALTMTVSGGSTYIGVIQSQGAGNPEIAVFVFDIVDIPFGVTVSATGSRPLAILSSDWFNLAGVVDVSGNLGGAYLAGTCSRPGSGGSGVAGSGSGGSGASACGGPESGEDGNGVGGGGGGIFVQANGNGGGGGSFGGSVGAPSYGELSLLLEAGSGGGGGASANGSQDSGSGGGSGGGGLELGAVGDLVVSGEIYAFGGDGGNADHGGAGGGGSGGGVLLHGGFVEISQSAFIDARGGLQGEAINNGGHGAGGRVLVEPEFPPVFILNLSVVDVSSQSPPGGNGVVEYLPVPEPSRTVLLSAGIVGLALLSATARSRRSVHKIHWNVSRSPSSQ